VKVLFAVHGWPPEACGGTESSTRALALALRAGGHDVRVCAGSLQPAAEGDVALVPAAGEDWVTRVQRPDLYFEHWHKERSPDVAAAWRRLVATFEPDVVHVHHWLRLTRGLVRVAAELGVPAVVTLHDFHASCPLHFRLRPESGAVCDEPAGSPACPGCAGVLAPPTPFVTDAAQRIAQRDADHRAELALARALVVPSRSHGRALARSFGEPGARLQPLVIAPAPAIDLPEPRERPSRRPGGRLRLATWGHVVPVKGLDVLVAALERTSAPERFELDVAGPEPDPDYRAGLERRARRATLRFHGPFEADGLADHPVAGADSFVSGTLAPESYGLTLDEAWRLGLPALVPASGAFVERATWTYPRGDVDALARELDAVRAEPWRLERERERARARASALPTAEDVARRHVELYARVVELGAPRAELAPAPDDDDREALAAWDRAVSKGGSGAPH